MVIALLLAACSTLSTLDGAKTLAPGQASVSAGLSLQAGNNPVAQTGLPIPQLETLVRVGIAPDVDVGFRLYLLGVGSDIRYRVWHADDWHLATGLGVSTLPLPGAGFVEAKVPLTLQRDLSRRFSVSGGPRAVLRDQWNATVGGTITRLDTFLGGGARAELVVHTFVIGLGGDLYARPSRHALPAWSVALGIGWRGLSEADRRARDAR